MQRYGSKWHYCKKQLVGYQTFVLHRTPQAYREDIGRDQDIQHFIMSAQYQQQIYIKTLVSNLSVTRPMQTNLTRGFVHLEVLLIPPSMYPDADRNSVTLSRSMRQFLWLNYKLQSIFSNHACCCMYYITRRSFGRSPNIADTRCSSIPEGRRTITRIPNRPLSASLNII